jgi:hypothetical protein
MGKDDPLLVHQIYQIERYNKLIIEEELQTMLMKGL